MAQAGSVVLTHPPRPRFPDYLSNAHFELENDLSLFAHWLGVIGAILNVEGRTDFQLTTTFASHLDGRPLTTQLTLTSSGTPGFLAISANVHRDGRHNDAFTSHVLLCLIEALREDGFELTTQDDRLLIHVPDTRKWAQELRHDVGLFSEWLLTAARGAYDDGTRFNLGGRRHFYMAANLRSQHDGEIVDTELTLAPADAPGKLHLSISVSCNDNYDPAATCDPGVEILMGRHHATPVPDPEERSHHYKQVQVLVRTSND